MRFAGLKWEMSFEPRSIINGKLFREFMGKNVSVMVKIEGDYTGQIIKAKTTDQVPVRISLSEPIGGNPTDWVEVIGVVSGADMLRAKEVITVENSW